MDKRLTSALSRPALSLRASLPPFSVKLNANRKVTGVLRGFDQFMNLVLESAVEEVSATERHEIGMIVRSSIVRGIASLTMYVGDPWQQCGAAGAAREGVSRVTVY